MWLLALFAALALPCVASPPPAFVAKPLHGGAIHVACVHPRYAGLDLDALAARVDIDVQRVMVWQRDRLAFDSESESADPKVWSAEAITEHLSRLFSKKRPEVLILANIDAGILPEPVQSAIVGYVESGGSLAMSYVAVPAEGPLRAMVDGLQPVDEEPGFARGLQAAFAPDGTRLDEAAQASAHGAGRVVVFDFSGDIPVFHALFPPPAPGIEMDPYHADHACALWARVLLWLTGRTPPLRFVSLHNVSPQGPSDAEVPPDLPEEFIESMRDSVVAQSMRAFAAALDGYADKAYRVDWRVRPLLDASPGYTTASTLPKGADRLLTQLYAGPGMFYVDAHLKQRDDVLDWYSEQIVINDWPEVESIRADKAFLLANDRLNLDVEVRSVYSVHRSATVYAQAVDSFGRLVAQAWQPVTHAGGRVTLTLTFADLIAPLVEVRLMALEGEPRPVTSWDYYTGALDRLRFPVQFTRQGGELDWVASMPTLVESNAEMLAARLKQLGVSHIASGGGRPALVAAARHGLMLVPKAAEYAVDEASGDLERSPGFTENLYIQSEDERLREEVLDYFAGGSGAYLLGDPALVVASEENACQSPGSLAAFRRWAKERRIELPVEDDALRALILPPDTPEAEATADYIDFRRFTEEQFATFLAQRRRTLRQAHPAALVGITALDDRNPYRGYDWHSLARELDFVAAAWDPSAVFKLSSYGSASALSGFQAHPSWTTQQHMHGAALAAMARFGAVWIPGACGNAIASGTGLLLDELGNPTETGHVLGAAMERLNEGVAPLLRLAEPAVPVVSILDAPRSRHVGGDAAARHRASEQALVSLMQRAGFWPHFTRASEAADAAQVRVLLCPDAILLDEGEVAALKRFHAAGGLLVCNEGKTEGLAQAVGEEALRGTNLEGDGGVSALWEVLREREVTPPIPFEIDRLAKSGGVSLLARGYRYGAADIFVTAPYPDQETRKAQELSLEFAKQDKVYLPLSDATSARSRRARMEGDQLSMAVRLDYEARELKLEAPELVTAGGRVDARCMLATDTVKPGRHLVLLTLALPGGKPIAGGRRWLECEQGRGASFIPVPLNAIPGVYQLRARDLLTGLESRKMVEIAPPSGPGFQSIH
ncbi:MAG: Beta-galactosidase [Candidatus Hydrogenedentota bacterium]